jgi:hypothetical protein
MSTSVHLFSSVFHHHSIDFLILRLWWIGKSREMTLWSVWVTWLFSCFRNVLNQLNHTFDRCDFKFASRFGLHHNQFHVVAELRCPDLCLLGWSCLQRQASIMRLSPHLASERGHWTNRGYVYTRFPYLLMNILAWDSLVYARDGFLFRILIFDWPFAVSSTHQILVHWRPSTEYFPIDRLLAVTTRCFELDYLLCLYVRCVSIVVLTLLSPWLCNMFVLSCSLHYAITIQLFWV